ncbi:MAG: T9SS type A sorting domain-containing protein [Flavobacteriales bacterium]
MKRSLLLVGAMMMCAAFVTAQVTDISVETYYTDDASVTGYPADHTTYRIYANCTNEEDRVTSVFGDANAPLILTVTGGIWNHAAGGVLGTGANCTVFAGLPAAEYDSYVTFDYTCNAPGNNTIYSVEDVGQPWKTAAFNTTPYGQVNTMINSTIGGAWFGLPDADDDAGDNTRAGADLQVLIAQITIPNSGSICGIFNIQCFPDYQDNNDPYIEQFGMQFGTIDCGTPGCTDDTALNYNLSADFDNGLCLFPCGLEFDTEVMQPTCSYNTDGSISFTGTGNQDFMVHTFEGDDLGLLAATINGLGNGTYTLQLHDTRFDNDIMNPGGIYGDCTVMMDVELNTEAIVLDMPMSDALTCFDSADGCADLMGYSGGTGDLTFDIMDEFDVEVAGDLAGPSYCGIEGGMFYYIATDENGCEEVSTMFEVVEPGSIALLEGAELAASCFNSADGTQVFNFGGGTGDLDFELDGNGDFEIEGGAFNLVLNNMVPGDYTLYAQDENFCLGSTTFSVSGGPEIFVDTDTESPLCNGDSNGNITINATGGTGTFMYSADGNVYDAGNVLSGYGAGDHMVFVMDENDCVAQALVSVSEPEALTATAEGTDVLCNGDANGTITITAVGGTVIYAYSLDGVNYSMSPLFEDLAPSTYEIYVEDANGCQYNDVNGATIGEPAALDATADATDVTCNGDDDGEILIDATGGTGPYEYSAGGAPDDTNPITGLDPDTYDVVVTDANGCEFTISNVEITEPVVLSIDGLTPDPIDETPGGNSTYDVSGGTTPYEYEWVYDGDVVGTDEDLDDITDATEAGAYTLTVTDANGCTDSQTINITGLDELGLLYNISIYPNPTQGLVLLNMSGLQGEKVTLQLTDEAGRIVLARELGNVTGVRTETIDATQCAAGVYHLHLIVGSGTHTARLVIQ